MSKIIDRYNKQMGKDNIKSPLMKAYNNNDSIDNWIEAHQKAKEFLKQYQEQEQKKKLDQQMEKEIQEQIEKQVKQVIEQTFKDLFKQHKMAVAGYKLPKPPTASAEI